MRGTIIAREAGASLPETPAQAKQRGEATLETLLAKARADAAQVQGRGTGSTHLLTAGVGDGFGASALRFINGDKTIRRGDTVVWAPSDPVVIHTVTLTSGAAPPESL